MSDQPNCVRPEMSRSAPSVLELIEFSCREILRQYVFQPNNAQTWAAVRSAISNLLAGLWAEGKLVGASPTDAFSVACGLGSTMTGEDILQAKLIAVISVAVVHPAEFVVITVQETMVAT